MEYSRDRGVPNAPLNIGETYEVEIEDVGREGDGIARVEGFVVFVPNTKKGDKVKIKVTKVSRRVGFAEVV
ncbi:deoxyribonuclease [ANME-1 cluster archaeon ex4572_4]|nr:MAG: deoxyribonuclease [ANME-1 cluster archaeon ex4572_4]PXF50905.1 MAG: deoxyribonuclease [Methanophagales archaeon]